MADQPPNLEYDYRKQRYETYIKDRDALRHDSLEVSGRYDKAILALAGGALALSITFLEKIAPHPVPWTFALLAVAWLCLIASVLLELYALSTSQTVTNEQIAMADEEYRQYLLSLPDQPVIPTPLRAPESQEVVERWRRKTRRFNDWSRWLLSIGVFLLCAFCFFNLPFRGDMGAKPINESRGSYVAPANALPPPPPPSAPAVAPTAAPATPAPATPA
ncbi:MAG TPA: hypothetical protein VF511_07645, partial [Chthoniobacterales bacterium]